MHRTGHTPRKETAGGLISQENPGDGAADAGGADAEAPDAAPNNRKGRLTDACTAADQPWRCSKWRMKSTRASTPACGKAL